MGRGCAESSEMDAPEIDVSDPQAPDLSTPKRPLDAALFRGISLVALFAAVAGAARVAQDALIAWRFGAGAQVDAYYFMVSLAAWPVAVALSTLTLLIAPVEAALQQGEPAAARRFRGELLGAALCAALAALPLAWWALDTIAGGPVSGLQRPTAAFASTGAPAMALVVSTGLLAAVLAAWMVALGRQSLTLVESVPSLVLIAALLLMPQPALYGATAAGIALQTLFMVLLLKRGRELPRPRLGLTSAAWSDFYQGGLLLLSGQMLFALVPLVDPFFAARLGDGVVAALSFANRLVLGLQGLVGLAIQRAGLPLLSRLMTTSPLAARAAVVRWAAIAAASGVFIGLIVAASADPLVALLFERGRFTAQDREQVATLLRYGMLQLPPFFAGLVVVTALASAGSRASLVIAAGLGLTSKILLSAVLVRFFGVSGLLVATALMYLITTAVAWSALVRGLGRVGCAV